MEIREYRPEDFEAVVRLKALFHQAMSRLKGRHHEPDFDSARKYLRERVDRGETVHVATTDGRVVGYQVLCTSPSLRLEELYVEERFRRRGAGLALFDRAEQIMHEQEEETLYIMAHPNNHAVIRMLASRGYDVLNLVELRKRWPQDRPCVGLEIMGHRYAYESPE